MNTHRYLTLFLSLATSTVFAQTQPMIALNTDNPTVNLPTAVKSPRKPKAVEAPFYIKLFGFYGLLTPGSRIETSYSQSSTGTNTQFTTNSKGLGAGPRAGAGIGVIVSDFINLGIDADMLFGAELKTDNRYKGSNYTYTSTTTTNLRVLSITPNITFKALSRPAYYIYNRLGIVGGIVMEYKTAQTSLNAPTAGAPTTGETLTDYSDNSLALGYQAAIGIQFRLGESLRGFAEVVAINQSFQPKESKYTSSSTKSGVTTKTTYFNQYRDEGEYITTKKEGSDVYQNPSYTVAMNSVGLGAGILFRF
ncbi:hypothetical protein IC229_10445 [Spirosoma sp. BT702]|uniref:Outer membrane protein beta-barrel domain-containing protein n=1 Tax=Spirosoma profusum TaxID=2771354 RepID=A0A927AN39_9BACT|nr:hypothetical protein [Spirosoma profusum]MBD2701054.1 hypothetical protein [Spirosoma profusum]